MKIIILAFIISISLHFFLFKKYNNDEFKKNNQIKQEVIKKSDVKFIKLKKEEPIINNVMEEKVKPIIEKKVELPEIQKEVVVKKEIQKKVENNKKIDFDKSKELQKKVLNEQIVNKKESLQDKTLEDFLSQKQPINKEILNELQKLYGEEYDKFTKVQKAYLEKNLTNFQTITQRVLNRLGYPPLAAKLRIGGVNVIEFMFHPDGSITGLKVIDSSGYAVLDDYSVELIEIAYKDYPKPQTSTKLRFNVQYRLY
ncbi:MAG: TonB family protein [Aliarcobacter sp.]|jgi:protein TonB|nr:TonB family protein [Aliarcobacter sp.]